MATDIILSNTNHLLQFNALKHHNYIPSSKVKCHIPRVLYKSTLRGLNVTFLCFIKTVNAIIYIERNTDFITI